MIYPTIDLQKTGSNIKRIREDKGIRVEDVREVLGLTSPQAIYKWEAGKNMPTLDNLVILAWLFGVKIDELIGLRG